MELTFVIPVYNRAALVTRLLDSIDAQTARGFKVIITDNASTDNTRDTIESWISSHQGKGIQYTLLSESTPGAAAARNRGLAAVDTPYVCFYDSDDTIRPNFVETILRGIRSGGNPDLVLYTSATHFLDGKTVIATPAIKNLFEEHLLHGVLRTVAYVASTEFIRETGGWNNSAMVWNDWELGIRIVRRHGIKIAPAGASPIADIYIQEQSITGTDYASRTDRIGRVLQLAEEDLRGDAYGEILLDIVRARMAGRIRREGSKSQAKELRAQIGSNGMVKQLILNGVYWHTVILKRGSTIWAAPLARLLYRRKQ